jgi:hypothetical protein
VSFSGGRYRCQAACINRARGPVDHDRVRAIIVDTDDQEAPLARGVDEFVTAVIAERRANPTPPSCSRRPRSTPPPCTLRGPGWARLRARLTTIDNEYDEGIIDGRRWRTAKEKVNANLDDIKRKLSALTPGNSALGDVLDSPDRSLQHQGPHRAPRYHDCYFLAC